jgi:hypothetical protein
MTKPQVSIPLDIPDVQVLKSEMTKAGELIIIRIWASDLSTLSTQAVSM